MTGGEHDYDPLGGDWSRPRSQLPRRSIRYLIEIGDEEEKVTACEADVGNIDAFTSGKWKTPDDLKALLLKQVEEIVADYLWRSGAIDPDE